VYKAKQIKVLKCEYLLPGLAFPFDTENADANVQDAFIFEFHAPFALAALRDATYFVLNAVAKPQGEDDKANKGQPPNTSAILSMSSLAVAQHGIYLSAEHRSLICPLKFTQAGKKKTTKNVMLHNGAGESSFFLACSLQCGAFRAPPTEEHPREQLLWCSAFAVEPAYGAMQSFLGCTKHTENEVLARQAECPEGIALSEFKCFGALRSGHRLQLKNMLAALESRSLSLDQDSVVSLLSQALWQAECPSPLGPGDAEQGIRLARDSHMDLLSEGFCGELLRVCGEVLVEVQENWKHHRKLLAMINIALRCLSLAPNFRMIMKAVEVLTKCRAMADDWGTNNTHKSTDANTQEIDMTPMIALRITDAYTANPRSYAHGARPGRDGQEQAQGGRAAAP
jgi:hypothetical protein